MVFLKALARSDPEPLSSYKPLVDTESPPARSIDKAVQV